MSFFDKNNMEVKHYSNALCFLIWNGCRAGYFGRMAIYFSTERITKHYSNSVCFLIWNVCRAGYFGRMAIYFSTERILASQNTVAEGEAFIVAIVASLIPSASVFGKVK